MSSLHLVELMWRHPVALIRHSDQFPLARWRRSLFFVLEGNTVSTTRGPIYFEDREDLVSALLYALYIAPLPLAN